MKQKNKILVCLSGGVDSSAAAALLVKQGYNVEAAFMVNYEAKNEKGISCWQSDYQDALRVSAKLGIKLYKLNFVEEYEKMVLDYMYKQYENGLTPNPDILCNKFIKFGVWLKKAEEMGFDKIATGHYAQIAQKKDKYLLLQAKDKQKDQTYFLHQLNQNQLSKIIFPLGKIYKTKVRKLATKFDLPNADKEESMGICFIGEVPMKKFLSQRIAKKEGDVVLSSTGSIIGKHDGLAFNTIGQRYTCSNLGGTLNKPLFVLCKNIKKNELVVGFDDDNLLYAKSAICKNTHWISGQTPNFRLKCKVRLRHQQKLQNCTVEKTDEADSDTVKILFNSPQRAVTPGQFAVFYKSKKCLGGGVIA